MNGKKVNKLRRPASGWQTTCENCEFYQGLGDMAICRRFPPNKHAHCNLADCKAPAEYPYVMSDDWCGEFRPGPQATAPRQPIPNPKSQNL